MNVGTELNNTAKKGTALPIAAALTIADACICGLAGLIGVRFFAWYIRGGFFVKPDFSFYLWSFVGVFGLSAFALGLITGMMLLKRKHFWLSKIGVFFFLVPAGPIFLWSILARGGWLFGVPYFTLILSSAIGMLSIVSLILVALSKRQFS